MALQEIHSYQPSLSDIPKLSREQQIAIQNDPEFMETLRRYNSGADKEVRHDVYGKIEVKLSRALIPAVIRNLDAILSGTPTIH